MSDKDKMKNNSNKDDVDQSNNLQNEEPNETSQEQAELSLQEKLVQSQEEASKNWDKILRLQAEIQNLRKRTFRDIESASRGSIERVVMEILPILDSFELYRGLEDLYSMFSSEAFLLVFWLHFLSISLFLGAWISRDSQRYMVPRFFVIISLILTYFTGPAGLLIYWFIRIFFAKKINFND